MYMRDLACCAGGMAFYSTPSDLVRFALATKAESVNGELAGGSVMSLMTRRDSGIAVAVASNVAYANTAALALKVAGVFATLRSPAIVSELRVASQQAAYAPTGEGCPP